MGNEKEKAVRKALWIVGLALVVPAVASAQDVPRVEVFGGYSYGLIRGYVADELVPGSGTAAFPSFGSNGWTGSVAVNATRWCGVVAEAGGLYSDLTMKISGTPFTLGMLEHSYLFGPRFSSRYQRWALFGHALYGEAHARVSMGASEVLIPVGFVETKAAMGLGAGLDYTVYRRRRQLAGTGQELAIRLGQIDWLRTGFSGSHQDNIRLTAGLVFRF